MTTAYFTSDPDIYPCLIIPGMGATEEENTNAVLIIGGKNSGWFVDSSDVGRRRRLATAEEVERAKCRYWNVPYPYQG